jgi:hypothetical protein
VDMIAVPDSLAVSTTPPTPSGAYEAALWFVVPTEQAQRDPVGVGEAQAQLRSQLQGWCRERGATFRRMQSWCEKQCGAEHLSAILVECVVVP